MRLDYLFFIMFLYPSIKGLYFHITGKSEELKERKRTKQESMTSEKMMINSSVLTIFSVTPYFAAFYYAEFKYFWLMLGIIYLLTGILTLIAASSSQYLKVNDPGLYKKTKKESKKELKNVDFWPKWQVHALCAFNITVLALWFYSWRYLYA